MGKKKLIMLLAAAAIGIICLMVYVHTLNERITYGEDIEAIQSEFPDISGIESCHYKVEIIGSPLLDFLGPTNYRLMAVITIGSDEMDRIVHQYEEEKNAVYLEVENL